MVDLDSKAQIAFRAASGSIANRDGTANAAGTLARRMGVRRWRRVRRAPPS